MIITDFNKMSLEDLDIIHYNLGISLLINDGRISGTEEIPTQTANPSGDK